MMEPWDGPACVTFTDGTVIGAVLDRNGLRPGRWWRTTDDLVVLASEAGVLEIDPATWSPRVGCSRAGCSWSTPPRRDPLRRGHQGRARGRAAVRRVAARRSDRPDGPARARARRVHPRVGHPPPADLRLHRGGAARPGRADGHVRRRADRLDGHRHPGWRCCRKRPRLLFDYFAELFAQVTNPPLDAIREEMVTSIAGAIGPEQNLLDPESGVLPPDRPSTAGDRQRRAGQDLAHQRRRRHARLQLPADRRPVPACTAAGRRWPPQSSASAGNVRRRSRAVRGSWSCPTATATPTTRRFPSLLLTSAVHQHLVRTGQRTQVGLVVESGDAREVHHVALLIGYGAAAVNPYLAFESIEDLVGDGCDHRCGCGQGDHQLRQGARQGRAQGDVEDGHLDDRVLHRRAGVRGDRSGPDARRRVLHRYALAARRRRTRRARRGGGRPARTRLPASSRPSRAHRRLEVGGEYQWRREGELHLFNPETVFLLQHATRQRRYEVFAEYTDKVEALNREGGDPARAVRAARGRAPAGPDRRGRAGRSRS